MVILQWCKMQIVCLLILTCIGIIRLKDAQAKAIANSNAIRNRYYNKLFCLSFFAIIFDGLTACSVNFLNIVPDYLNRIFHIGMYLSYEIYIYLLFEYWVSENSEINKERKFRFIFFAPCMMFMVATIALIKSLRFEIGQYTNYSMGPSVYVSFACIGFYGVLIIAGIILKLKDVSLKRKKSMIGILLSVCIILVIQIIFPEFLITCCGIAIITFSLYVTNEIQNTYENSQEMIQQTIEALATTIDAADKYTHGHSIRVAEYSLEIAKRSGASPRMCREVNYAALLHDVGKIGISDDILNKEGKLTDEEYAVVKQHPVLGEKILSRINKSPYLSVGAHYHHERFDGRGYPEGLKGEEIPELARIIAVADAYDAMTSKRSYRDQIAQQKVREEIVKGMGTQFDPKYAGIMVQMMDEDLEYRMREHWEKLEFEDKSFVECKGFFDNTSGSLRITSMLTTISFKYKINDDSMDGVPAFILFDSLDAKYYPEGKMRENMDFFEYACVDVNGIIIRSDVRKLESNVRFIDDAILTHKTDYNEASVDVIKQGDHILLRIKKDNKIEEITMALSDKSRYAYILLSGVNCIIKDIKAIYSRGEQPDNYIARIAEEVSYIDVPEGDIPNVQIDGWCMDGSKPISIKDGTIVTFHTMSLPSAMRVWHSPIIKVFTEDDRQISFIRYDGECWNENTDVVNSVAVLKDKSFKDWNDWKAKNKTGVDCSISISKNKSNLTVRAYNHGITIVNQTTLAPNMDRLYMVITGDQCALTNIKIHN